MEIDTWYCEYARISCRVLGWRIGTTFSISFTSNWTILSRQKFPESKAWILVENLHISIRISLHSYFYQNQTMELSWKRLQLHQLVSRLADTDNFRGFGCDLMCQKHCDCNRQFCRWWIHICSFQEALTDVICQGCLYLCTLQPVRPIRLIKKQKGDELP